MRILKILAGIVVVLVLLVVVVFIGARFADGPLGPIAGGALASGEIVSGPVADWGFAESVDTIELQLDQDDTSRTTWILVDQGKAYIPCSLSFPPGKSWHLRADQDGRATVRVLGRRYPVVLERLQDASLEPRLKEIVSSKYGGGPPGDSGVWFFSVESGS